MADTVQSEKEIQDISKDTAVSSITENNLDVEVNEEGKNLKQIKCQRCPSTILVSGTATLVTNKVYIIYI